MGSKEKAVTWTSCKYPPTDDGLCRKEREVRSCRKEGLVTGGDEKKIPSLAIRAVVV